MPPEEVLQKSGFIDLHQDMLLGVARLEGGFPDYSPMYLTGSSRVATVFSSLFPHGVSANLIGELEAHDALLESHPAALRLITTVDDLLVEDSRVGVLPHSEGFELPGVEPEMLAHLWADHSLRSLALTWNHETPYAFSCYDDGGASLKPAGRELLRTLERSPILLDLAHLNDAGFHEALDAYAPPVLISHTFCRSIVDHPRGLDDDQLRATRAHGGLVGLAFVPEFLGERGSVDEVLRHIDKVATLAGERAVSIGTDWGVADMGELSSAQSLLGLVEAVAGAFGSELAERFAFGNAHDFLCAQLPIAS
ncbi:MAG: membrane dipeptidase [Coriobacteriia bacterium]|nr:membrane dipeptidase [Coriobacteriia bacterium]